MHTVFMGIAMLAISTNMAAASSILDIISVVAIITSVAMPMVWTATIV